MAVLSVASRAREIFESHLVRKSVEKSSSNPISVTKFTPTQYILKIKMAFYGLAIVK